MAKRVLFTILVLSALVIFLLTGQCFADVLDQLEKVETYKWYPAQAEQIYQEITQVYPGSDYALTAHKNLVISYLSAKRGGDAQQTLDELAADFNDHSGLPTALYEIARIYERSREYEKANNIYQQIIQQYPDSSSTEKAQLAGPRMAVLSHIESKDDDAAQAATNSLIANFSSHSELPASLYDTARRYERANNYKKAKSIYQQITQQYPDSFSAGKAQVGAKRTNILSLIELGNDDVDGAINILVTDFSGHTDLSEALYDIARKYEKRKKYEQAKSVYQQIIQQHSDGSHASRAQLIVPKIDIFSLIESGEDNSAQLVLDKLIADFSGHSYLPAVLDEIARRYERLGKYQEAKNIYQQIVQQYPRSLYASKAELGMQKNQIFFFIDIGKTNEAQAAVDKLVSDFFDNPRLPWALCRIAEQYLNKATPLEDENLLTQAQDYLQRGIAICEMVISELPASKAIPEACYFAGHCHRRLGEYGKSTQYYQKIVDDYPGDRMAWNALFLTGRNYEKLKESGSLSESEADSKIKAAYQQLLEKYPDCKAASHAKYWLAHHN